MADDFLLCPSALMQVATRIPHISCIAQVTFKFVYYTSLVDNGGQCERQEELNSVAILICFVKNFAYFRRVTVVEIELKACDFTRSPARTDSGPSKQLKHSALKEAEHSLRALNRFC